MSIGDAIKQNPEIIQILSEENIDFCCGGNRVLKDVLDEKKLDVDSFIDLLNRQPKKQYSNMEDAIHLNREDLIDYIIKTHHMTELNMIEEIDKNLQKLIHVHYQHHGQELSHIYEVFMTMKSHLIPHFAKEEKSDFPDFLSKGYADFDELKAEHEQVGELLKTLERKTNDYTPPSDGCLTYKRTFQLLKELQDDIHQHIFLENSVLFLK